MKILKTNGLSIAVLFVLISSLSSCQLIGDIFKGGVYVGVIMVVVVIVAVIWLITRLFRR